MNNCKCHQCGIEEAETYVDPYDHHNRLEICFSCGYVRKITYYHLDVQNEITSIHNFLTEHEELSDGEKIHKIKGVLDI